MLRTKLLGFLHNGACSCIEPLTESSIISRSVIGTFGESGRNRNWRYDNHAYIRPKLTRILHLIFPLSHEISGDDPTTNYSITAIKRPAAALVTSPSLLSGWMTVGKLVFTGHNPGLRRDGAPWADTHIRSGPGPTCAGIMSVARPSGSAQARARRGSTRAALSLSPAAIRPLRHRRSPLDRVAG